MFGFVVANTEALDEEQRARTAAAMKNVHFRRALTMGLDRGAYNAQDVGEELKFASIINSYTPGTFVSLEEDTTVAINGEDVPMALGPRHVPGVPREQQFGVRDDSSVPG